LCSENQQNFNPQAVSEVRIADFLIWVWVLADTSEQVGKSAIPQQFFTKQ